MIQEIRASGVPIYRLQPGDLLRRMPPDHHHAWEYPDGRLLVYQPHSHILVTMRSIGPDGFGLKQREWNSPVLLNRWRESWEQTYNKLLVAVGSTDRVSAKAKTKAYREMLAADGISPDSPGAPLEPLRQFNLKGGIYAFRDDRPPRQNYGDFTMRPSILNERIRLLLQHEAEAEEKVKVSTEQAKRWQSAWAESEANALAQQQRAQEAEREKRIFDQKLKAEQKARLDLEHGVETLTEQLAEPLGASAPKQESILERLRSVAAGAVDLLRQETARAEKAEKRVRGLEKYLRRFFEWTKTQLPGARTGLEREELRILGESKPLEVKVGTADATSQNDAGGTANTEDRLRNSSPSPAKLTNRPSTERFRKKSAAVNKLLWTLPESQQTSSPSNGPSKSAEPRAAQSPPARKRVRDEYQR